MNAQEANGEQREKNGGKFAETDDFGRAVLKRKPPETAPTLGKRAKKIPTDKGWDFGKWWSQGGSNSRPRHCERRALPAELWPRKGGQSLVS